MQKENFRIAVCGLGYVGLPLAVALGKHFNCIGFDVNNERISKLQDHHDVNTQIPTETLEKGYVKFTANLEDIKSCNIYIVAIPTPVDSNNRPDLTLLKKASTMLGPILNKGDFVIYESTVYPGATEELCIPLLEQTSGLQNKIDFHVGYSPERLNPGDDDHSLSKITKLISAQDESSLEVLNEIYSAIVSVGVFKTSSIKVAEASKVVENTQRDLNIALMNELALIFDRMGIDTLDVIEAAATKWNFQKYNPGLVGGHCIGVDPYYLTYKAESLNYHPEVILAGRRINDNMGKFIAEKTIKELVKNGHDLSQAVISVLGLAYKENCTDVRNSKSFDILNEFAEYNIGFQIQDHYVNPEEVKDEYHLKMTSLEDLKPAQAIVVTVPHKEYVDEIYEQLDKLLHKNGLVMDIKGKLDREKITAKGYHYWRL